MGSIIHLARESIQKLVPYSSARLESLQEGIHLDANENPFMRPDGLNRYPCPQPVLLRQMFANLYDVEPAQLLMTRGSDEGIDLLIRSFCEANKEAIVITPPTYGMYEVAANIQGVRIIKVPLEQDAGFALNKDTILNQRNSAIKLIFLCSPNNPTGNVLDSNEVLTLCKALQNQALVVLDEAYIEFSTTKSMSDFVSQYPNLVILRTLSKAFGLAGARIGALIANQEVIKLLMKVIAPYPIPIPVERAAMEVLSIEHQAIVHAQIQNIRREREKLRDFLIGLPSVECVYSSQANFLLVKVHDASKWMDTCKAHQIIIRSRVHLLGLHNCVRISVGTDEENKRLKEVLSYV
ncbi:histidinol-phosphate transaminase [Legionella fairfieldensis]|uniref:histidinol-phosphate transaminase n=1 Tax=Legionella fairfieldensis TaxID=45064 RepID=UPI00055D403D|nr:histidinol-phosphate transaminase [Legionella fairfieldensis]